MKRIISIFVAMLLVITIIPSASAESSAVLKNGDFVYIGSFSDSPIKWRVLNAQKTNAGGEGAFLLSEFVLDSDGTCYDEESVGWEGSMGQWWCTVFFKDSFSDAEKAVIPAITKHEDECKLYNLSWATNDLKDENAFFMSTPEIAEYFGEYNEVPVGAVDTDGNTADYWLRTSHRYHNDYAGFVFKEGYVHDFLVAGYRGCRPAINLDFSKIISFEPAADGKTNEWKVVLEDDSLQFDTSGVKRNGTNLSADYNIKSDAGKYYISTMIMNSDGSLFSYNRIKESTDLTGTVSLDMSSMNIPEGGKLQICCEQDGGDYCTNRVSSPVDLSCEASFDPNGGTGTMETIGVAPGGEITIPESTFTPPYGGEFDHWEMMGEAVSGKIKLDQDVVVKAIYSNIAISSISFASPNMEQDLFTDTVYSAIIGPENVADKTLLWESSSSSVAVVSDGGNGYCTVKAIFPGTATITARTPDGDVEGSFTVTVAGNKLMAFIGNYSTSFMMLLMFIIIIIVATKKKGNQKVKRRSKQSGYKK